MIIEVKNITNQDIQLPELNVENQYIPAFSTRQVYNNENHELCPINPISAIQNCCELKDFIVENKIVFVVNGIEATKQQSLNIINPIINFP